MNLRWLFLFALGLVELGGSFTKSQVAEDPGDMHGTLVMIARTNSEIILATDSAINVRGEGVHSDSTQKLILIGKNSACALDTWLGNRNFDINVPRDVHKWTDAHPVSEMYEALPQIQKIIIDAWNNYVDRIPFWVNFPAEYQAGKIITGLTCGGFLDGQPVIQRGEIVVGPERHALIKPRDPQCGDRLYASGNPESIDFLISVIQPAAQDDPTISPNLNG